MSAQVLGHVYTLQMWTRSIIYHHVELDKVDSQLITEPADSAHLFFGSGDKAIDCAGSRIPKHDNFHSQSSSPDFVHLSPRSKFHTIHTGLGTTVSSFQPHKIGGQQYITIVWPYPLTQSPTKGT
jgi:hypothetical protein